MVTTSFLAQIIGLYVTLIGVTMLLWKNRWWKLIHELCHPEAQVLNYMLGMITLPFGILLVLIHNVWNLSSLPALVVTIFGWTVLLKSILVFATTPHQLGMLVKRSRMESWWYGYVVIVLVIGLYLTYIGFTTTA